MAPSTRCKYPVSNLYFKTLRNSLENPEKSKTCKNNLLNSKIKMKNGTYVEKYTAAPLNNIWRIYLDLWGHGCKKWVWLTFGCRVGQNYLIVMTLKLYMSCYLLNEYTKFQIDISTHVENADGRAGGRTTGRTLAWHNTNIFSNGCIKWD